MGLKLYLKTSISFKFILVLSDTNFPDLGDWNFWNSTFCWTSCQCYKSDTNSPDLRDWNQHTEHLLLHPIVSDTNFPDLGAVLLFIRVILPRSSVLLPPIPSRSSWRSHSIWYKFPRSRGLKHGFHKFLIDFYLHIASDTNFPDLGDWNSTKSLEPLLRYWY